MYSRYTFRVFLLLLFFAFSFAAAANQNYNILYPEPNSKQLLKDYKSFSERKKLEDEKNNTKHDYLMGLSYLNGNGDLSIEKNSENAINYFRKAWDNGVVDSGYTLGLLYIKGDGVKKDLNMGKLFLTRSAEKGFLKSQKLLVNAYRGEALKNVFQPDQEEAIRWMLRAAKSGSQQACVDLAAAYKNGDGVGKNPSVAFEWLKKAESSIYQDGFSHLQMANYYEKGVGTKKNLLQAYKYYDLSGNAGIDDKQRIAKSMTQEQIDKAIQESQAWQKEHNIDIGNSSIRRSK